MTNEIMQLATLTRKHQLVSNACSNLVIKGQVVRGDRGFVEAYIKLLPPIGLLVETLCAWILARANIPAPEAFWVQVTKNTLERNLRDKWTFDDDTILAFGTLAVPNAMSLRNSPRNAEKLASQLQKWNALPISASFDEVIVNTDRNTGNILTNGLGDYWLIDHDRAFYDCVRSPGWEDGLINDNFPPFNNELFSYIENIAPSERLKLRRAFNEAVDNLRKAISALPWNDFKLESAHISTLQSFLTKRSERLRSLVFNRLGLPDLDLGEGQNAN